MGNLPIGVKAELKSLPKDLADTVGAHILAAGELIDVDPELAFKHAEAARRRAGRLPVVREAAAETAYAAGHYDVALREFRAIRRMSGGEELIPVMADCERALGRHREALELLNSVDLKKLPIWLGIEFVLVEAGVRDDLGQTSESQRILKAAINQNVGSPIAQARLRYAYANLLLKAGDKKQARRWFEQAASLDSSAELDTADRLAEIDGITLPTDFEIEAEPSNDAPSEPEAPSTE